jgi:hypothetical protein
MAYTNRPTNERVLVGIEAHVEGIDQLIKNFDDIVARADKAAQRIVEKGSVTIASNAKREFRARPLGSQRTSKTGKKYYDLKPPYQPQKPQPTNRTGNLRDGIKRISSTRKSFGRWESETGPTNKSESGYFYGARVEQLGYLYMRTGLDKSAAELKRIYEDEWAQALKG